MEGRKVPSYFACFPRQGKQLLQTGMLIFTLLPETTLELFKYTDELSTTALTYPKGTSCQI